MLNIVFLGTGDNHIITPDAILSVGFSTGILLTTAHAQDFKDIIGDELAGRRTFPIEYPTASRIAMFTTVFWSVLLTVVRQLSISVAVIFNFVGLAVALRFWGKRQIKADEKSYYLYCVRISRSLLSPSYCF